MRQPRSSKSRYEPVEQAVPRGAGRSPILIGDHNLRVILEAIRRSGPLTRLELGRHTGLTGPGITNILRRLNEAGLITDRKRPESGSGQPSTEFAVNADGAFGIGLRIDGQGGELVVLDLSGEIREREVFDAMSDIQVLAARALHRLKRSAGMPGRMLGVGIGAEDPEALPHLALEAAFHPLKVMVERDCVTALLAERTFGVGAVEGGVMLIVVNDRVRAGLLLRGLPFEGVHGKAGSIGAMRTGPDHVPLDSVVGLETFRQLLTPDERLRLAAGGDLELTPPIRAWISDAAGHLLDAIVASAGFLAPGAILIGGDLPRNVIAELIAQMSVERSDSKIRPYQTPWISPIRPASFPGTGIALGAALLPFFDLLLPSPMATA